MKLRKKITAILALAMLAIISVVGAACGNSSAEFKFVREMPAEVYYGNELYFRDYLPREVGAEYKLYASYYNTTEQKEVVEELSESLAFTFDYVSDYDFKIVRNDKDTLTCTIKSMPQAPRVKEGAMQQTARPNNVQNFDRLLLMIFGGLPLENYENASADPDYKIKATNVEFQSVEIDGSDVKSMDISSGKITFDKIGYYRITYTATNRAGTHSNIVTVRTVNVNNHIDTLNGYVLENGEGLDDNQLVFDMDDMLAPEDGASVRVRFGEGKGADSSIYNAVYDAFTGKYTVDGFAHALEDGEISRLYMEDPNGELYSANVTKPTIITQESIDAAGSAGQLYNATEGYILLGSDLDLSAYDIVPTTIFTGVLDGNGHTIKNVQGLTTIDAKGNKSRAATSLFSNVDNAIIKNLILDGITATTGAIAVRTTGACQFKNIIVSFDGHKGARTSILGYHADDKDFTSVKNVIIEMPKISVGENGSYVGMLTTHAGGKTYIENLFLVGGNGLIHSTTGNNATYVPKHYTKRLDSESGNAEANKDYFIGADAEVVYNGYNDGNLSPYVRDMADRMGMVVGLNNSNIERLQTASGGYWYLEEDIDLKGKVWDSTCVARNLTFEGNGFTIDNITYSKDANYKSFFNNFGGTIRNVTFNIKDMGVPHVNAGYKGIIGQNRGETLVDNVIINIDKFTGAGSGAIAAMTDNPITVKNTIVNIKEAVKCNYAGLLIGGTATSKTMTLSNVVVSSPSLTVTTLNGISNKGEQTEIIGVEGKDYVYAPYIYEYDASKITNKDLKALVEKTVSLAVTVLDNSNFEELQTATSGYFVLGEDIDMAGRTWAPEQTIVRNEKNEIISDTRFIGVFNGDGHKIYNYSAPEGHLGLFGWTGDGALIKNLDVVMLTNTSKGGIIGQVKGETTIQNVKVDVDNFATNYGGIITSVVQGHLIVKDSMFAIRSVSGGTTNPGFIAGGEAPSNNVTVDNVYAFDASGVAAKPYYAVNSNKDEFFTYNPDGEYAVEGVDYFYMSGDFVETDTSVIKNAEFKTFVEGVKENIIANAITLTNDNIDILKTATRGYYFLGEDIDMAGKEWIPEQITIRNDNKEIISDTRFFGVLNGQGHKIYNFTAAEGHLGIIGNTGNGAILKNFDLEVITNTSRSAVMGQVLGATTVQNVNVKVEKFSTNYGGVITAVVQGDLTVKDCKISICSTDGSATNVLGFVAAGEAASKNVILSNVYCFDASGQAVKPFGSVKEECKACGVNGEVAVEGVDYFYASGNIVEFDTNTIKDAGFKAYVTALQQEAIDNAIIINNGNVALIKEATYGYYVLSEDINLGDAEWTTTAKFTGTLDGKGYTISGLNFGHAQVGLFEQLFGNAKVKNLTLKVTADGNNNGSIAATIRNTGNVLENVTIDIVKLSGTAAGGIARNLTHKNGLALKDVLIVIRSSVVNGKNGILFGNYDSAEGSAVVDGLQIYDFTTATNNVTSLHNAKVTLLGTDGEEAVLGEDYNIYNCGDIFDFDFNTVADADTKADLEKVYQDELAKATVIKSAEDIKVLQSATSGYYLLGDDIDMSGITWAPTINYKNPFIGTFNGGGYKITGFTAPAGNSGFFGATGNGALIKNVDLEMVTNTSKGGLIGYVNGTTVVQDAMIKVDTLVAGHAGVIANVVQGELTVKDSYILIKSTSGTPKGDGFIAGGEADSKNVIISNVKVADATGVFTNPYKGIVNNAGVTLGVDGEPAVNGEDYFIFTGDYLDLDTSVIEDEVYKTLLEEAKEAVLKTVVRITKDGRDGTKKFDILLTEGNGYYLLEEDIDLTGVAWTAATAGATFTGTLNGQGHKVSNFNGDTLFKSFAGTVKNVTFVNASNTGNGLLVGGVSANVTILNSSFELVNTTGNRKSLLGYQTGGIATLKDVNIYMPTPPNNWGYAFITTHAISGISFDNVHMFGGSGTFHSAGGNHTTLVLDKATITGTEGEDYFIYNYTTTEIAEKLLAGEFSDDIAKFIKDIGLVIAITTENFGDLRTATNCYYYLEEDIDMVEAGFTTDAAKGSSTYGASASVTFSGVLNGNGHTISNFALANGQHGLLPKIVSNAVVKNLIIKGTVCGSNNGVLSATVGGTGIVFDNILIDLNKFSSYAGGVIVRNLTETTTDLKMNNVMIIVRDSLINGANGLLFGNYGATGKCVVENFYLLDLATAANKVTALHNGKPVITGTVNQYTAASQLDKATLPTQFLKDAYDVAFAG